MSNLSFIGDYKDKVIKLLINNPDIVELLNPIVNPKYSEIIDKIDVLLGGEWRIGDEMHYEKGHIFDYNFITDRTDDVKSFIFVEVIVDNVYDAAITNFKLIICPVMHKDLVRLDKTTTPTKAEMQQRGLSGNRLDMLCSLIDDTINGNSEMGIGKVEPCYRDYLQTYLPNYRYYGKCIAYTIKNYNENRNHCYDR